MICPIMSWRTLDTDGFSVVVDCKEGKCAWWDESYKGCIVHGAFASMAIMESAGVKLLTRQDGK